MYLSYDYVCFGIASDEFYTSLCHKIATLYVICYMLIDVSNAKFKLFWKKTTFVSAAASRNGNLNFENANCAISDVLGNKTPQIFNDCSVDYVLQNSESKFANIEVCETSL